VQVLSKWTGPAPAFTALDTRLGWGVVGDVQPDPTARAVFNVGGPADALAKLLPWVYLPLDDGTDYTVFVAYQGAMLDAVDRYTAAMLDAGFTFNGVVYPLDSDSRQQWLGLLTLSGSLTFPLHVTSNDGLTVTVMDQPTATACAQAALAAYMTITQTAAQTRGVVIAATTAADLDAITFG
jgi:hypothetical protein